MDLLRQRLEDMGAYASTFQRARKLSSTGGVLSCEVEQSAIRGSVHLAGLVRSSEPGSAYRVEVSLDLAEGDVVDYFCTCPVGDVGSGMCKHQVALALFYLAQQEAVKGARGAARPTRLGTARPVAGPPTSPQISHLLADITARRMEAASRKRPAIGADATARAEAAPADPVDLLVALSPLERDPYGAGSDGFWLLRLRVRSGKAAYVVKSIAGLVRAYRAREQVSYGKRLSFVHEPAAFTERARALLGVLERVVESQRALLSSRWGGPYAGRKPDSKELPLSAADVVSLLDTQRGAVIEFDPAPYAMRRPRSLRVEEGDPVIHAQLLPDDAGGCRLELPHDLECVATSGALYVLDAHRARRCSAEFAAAAANVLPLLLPAGGPLHINAGDLPEFCRDLLPALSDFAQVDAPPELFALTPPKPVFSFRIGLDDGLVTCRARVAYGSVELDLYADRRADQPPRDLVAEYHVQDVLESYFPLVDGILKFDEADDDRLFELLTDGLAELDELGEVELSERLRSVRVRPAPQLRVQARLTSGLLDVAIDSSGLAPQELRAYLASFKRRERFVRLSSGDIVKMGDDLRAVESLAAGLGVDPGELVDGVGDVPSNRVLFVDALLKKADAGSGCVRFERSAGFRSIVRELETFSDADIEMPASLANVLRGYQAAGVRWLGTLERFGFSGILADDMGLGKTLQVIAHILGCQKASDGAGGRASGQVADAIATTAPGAGGPVSPSGQATLVVAPASLVYNWMAELERFAPSLKAVAVAGSKAARARQIRESGRYDVLVTSYDLMKRDIGAYEQQRYRRVVLDEAQYIKNPATSVARCAKRLPAEVRLALTGTPIENRLAELWSIFDFLMPGLLGTREEFSKQFAGPVERGEFEATNRLRCLVAPFILRRLKSDVLADLPEKTESVVVAQMGAEQGRLYRASQDRLAMQVQHRLPEEFKREKLKVLAELTRLRQICCDPRLCFDGYEGGSAKLDTCVELVRTAVDGGHAVLVFSQFTSMLDLLGERLAGEGLSFFVLTGATSKEERARLVRRFQAGDARVFLISLKAGGVGLNLTAADVVVHYDPWWNLAAQNQATDRAHRIGQRRAVSVFKLIAQGTIEERMIEMQGRKHDLAQAVLGGEEMMDTSLSREDVLALLGA